MSGKDQGKIEFLRKNPHLLAELEDFEQKPVPLGNVPTVDPEVACALNEKLGIEIDPHSVKSKQPSLKGREAGVVGDGQRLICEIELFFGRFMVLHKGVPLVLALWTIATYMFQAFDTFPYLAVLSAAKRCGKTRLTELLALLAAKAQRTVNISEAALYRLVEAESPALILDEAEALAGKTDRAEAIRALLNAGNRRDAVVLRCVGNSNELRRFRVFCPKVVCGIGVCPDTIRDRSIVLWLLRRKPEEKIQRLLYRSVKPEGEQLRQQIVAYVETHRNPIEAAYTQIDVPFLEDRDAETWEPLFSVLSVADPARWYELRAVAERLTAQNAEADQDDSLALKLLADARIVFGEQRMKSTAELVSDLKALEESPWQDKELTPRKLARLLRPFGVRSQNVRLDHGVVKGYYREEFDEAWGRYL